MCNLPIQATFSLYLLEVKLLYTLMFLSINGLVAFMLY